jgi:hypothetical protein
LLITDLIQFGFNDFAFSAAAAEHCWRTSPNGSRNFAGKA